jgi:hypothetical protein
VAFIEALIKQHKQRTAATEASSDEKTLYGFSERLVHVIDIARDGTFLEVATKPERLHAPADPCKRSGKVVKSGFLSDPADYVLGLASKPKKPGKPEEVDVPSKRLAHFVEGVGIIARETKHPSVEAVVAFYERAEHERVIAALGTVKPKGNFVFRVAGDASLLHMDPQLQELWATWALNYQNPDGPTAHQFQLTLDFLRGDGGDAYARTTPPIKGVPNAGNSASLVSFNALAWTSPGHEMNALTQAPMTMADAAMHVAELNFMLEHNSKHRFTVRSKDAKFIAVAWLESAQPASADTFDPFALLAAEQQEGTPASLSASVLCGLFAGDLDEGSRVHVAVLRGNNGRIGLVSYNTMPALEYRVHADRYYDLLTCQGTVAAARQLCSFLTKKAGGRKTPPLYLEVMGWLTSFATQGTPAPRALVESVYYAIHSTLAYQPADEIPPWTGSNITTLVRLLRASQKDATDMSQKDKTYSIPFLFGRWYATLCAAQQKASHGKLGRDYSIRLVAVSESPSALVTLSEDAQYWLNKLRKHGYPSHFEAYIAEITAAVAQAQQKSPRDMRRAWTSAERVDFHLGRCSYEPAFAEWAEQHFAEKKAAKDAREAAKAAKDAKA